MMHRTWWNGRKEIFNNSSVQKEYWEVEKWRKLSNFNLIKICLNFWVVHTLSLYIRKKIVEPK